MCSSDLGQNIRSGMYDYGLYLSYDSVSKKITGCYEDYSGWNEVVKAPQFSCVFYIEGNCIENSCQVSTYFPADFQDDRINGKIWLKDKDTIAMYLDGEHGGCGNSLTMTDAPQKFTLQRAMEWQQIRFVKSGKSYFYKDAFGSDRARAYLVKNDFLCIDKIAGNRAHGTYYGRVNTSGWIAIEDLNNPYQP